MIHRVYDPARDGDDCRRIWREVGWLEKDQGPLLDDFASGCRALVADLHGRPESFVLSSMGHLRYLEQDLEFCAVCSVTTGYAGRRLGLAGKLTAELVALDAASGADVAGLGIFEQGYYDRLGFGPGPYEVWFSVDPSMIDVGIRPSAPVRLGPGDHELVHRSRLGRMRGHGSVTLLREELTRAEMAWNPKEFGLGFIDSESGRLTHHLWCGAESVSHGPYSVSWMCFEDHVQMLELMALLRGLGDQVSLIRLHEPSGIQLQDLVRTPIRELRKTRGSRFETAQKALAYQQLRICDMESCMEKTRLPFDSVTFNLRLTDPIAGFLDDDAPWRGVAGDYTVVLGPESGAVKGHRQGLPLLEASVGAFTRMWMGVRPASGLAVTDDLSGPSELLRDLEDVIRVPMPSNDWEY